MLPPPDATELPNLPSVSLYQPQIEKHFMTIQIGIDHDPSILNTSRMNGHLAAFSSFSSPVSKSLLSLSIGGFPSTFDDFPDFCWDWAPMTALVRD